jgi:ubiquinone/menaquinone biosynthesis C-methylase UbiE
MEKQHVYEVYEKIAPHFSHTRYKPWPKISAHLNALPDGSLVGDIGCGNGKYLGINPKIQMIGTDRSFNLISLCRDRSKSFQTFVADSLKLPLRSESLDSLISIAVIHHFSCDSLRIQALREMHRVLKLGGTMLVYVWAYEQEHKKFATQDVFVPWHLHDTYDESGTVKAKPEESKFIETGVKDKDKQSTVYHRYYHVFMEGELEKLIEANFAGQLVIK